MTTWTEYRAAHPGVRIREAANRLGTTELELLASDRGHGVTRLACDPVALTATWPDVGQVKVISRNEHAVVERVGACTPPEIDVHGGQLVGDIDLRLFFGPWREAFLVEEKDDRTSLQIFDRHGDAVIKLYAEDAAAAQAMRAVGRAHAHPDQTGAMHVEARPTTSSPDARVDVASFHTAWDAMQSTHEFFTLLRRFGVQRLRALALAGPKRAFPVTGAAIGTLLRRAAEVGLEIMIFVGNRGCIQIYTGAVHKIVATGPWLNVLDPRFNLHLREDAVAASWIVKKPTADGIVTSLELYDAAGDQIATLFGRRKPGMAELGGWRDLLAELAQPHAEVRA